MRRILFILLACVPTGCTLHYKPFSPWEEAVYRRASFGTYPDDVKRDPGAYASTLVAWPGTLDEVVFDTSAAGLRMKIRHHYFSWAVDGTTRKYWLSPRGEGLFVATWPLNPEWDLSEMRRLILGGDMVIVYGYPRTLSNDVIDLGQAEYVRHIPKKWFRTDVIDYGRPGEPVKSLGLGLP